MRSLVCCEALEPPLVALEVSISWSTSSSPRPSRAGALGPRKSNRPAAVRKACRPPLPRRGGRRSARGGPAEPPLRRRARAAWKGTTRPARLAAAVVGARGPVSPPAAIPARRARLSGSDCGCYDGAAVPAEPEPGGGGGGGGGGERGRAGVAGNGGGGGGQAGMAQGLGGTCRRLAHLHLTTLITSRRQPCRLLQPGYRPTCTVRVFRISSELCLSLPEPIKFCGTDVTFFLFFFSGVSAKGGGGAWSSSTGARLPAIGGAPAHSPGTQGPPYRTLLYVATAPGPILCTLRSTRSTSPLRETSSQLSCPHVSMRRWQNDLPQLARYVIECLQLLAAAQSTG